jgi:hypothetical protein
MGYTLTFEYDDTILEAVSASVGNEFTGSFSTNIGKESDRFSCLWFANDNVTVNGDFIVLVFNVLSDIETRGQINISYNKNDIISDTVDGVKVTVPEINYVVNKVVYQIGDVNLDGTIDVFDAFTIQKYAVDKVSLTDNQLYLADVNDDDEINVLDALDIQKFVVNKIIEFEKK